MTAVRLQSMLRRLRTLAVDDRDGQLLARFAAAGDQVAFEVLVRRHGSLVLSVCRRLLGDGPDVDDVFQATFLVLARKAGAIRKQASVASWLYGVALRLARRLQLQRGRRRQREQATDTLGHIAENRPMHVDPSTRASLRELGTLLDEELVRLPAKYREAVVLCHLEGLSTSEAATLLGWSLGTLKSRVKRGREMIRSRLVERGVTMSVGALAVALAEQTASAALPARLLRAALDGGVAYAAKPVPSAAVSAQAAALAQSVRTVTFGKLPMAMVALALTIFVGLATARLPAEAPDPMPPAPQVAAPAALALQPPPAPVDQHGDPLPAGALARLGTVRWRHGGLVDFVAFLPEGNQVLSAGEDRAIRLWDFATGKEIRHFGPCTPPPPGADGFTDDYGRLGFVAVTLSADGKTVAASFDQPVIQLWDVATGKELPSISLKDRGGPAGCLALAPTAPHLAAATPDGKVTIWNWKTGAVVRSFVRFDPNKDEQLLTTNGHLTYCPDGKGLLAVTAGVGRGLNPCLTLWDPDTGKERVKIGLDNIPFVGAPALSPDGKLVAMGSEQGPIKVWDLTTGKLHCSLESDASPPGEILLFRDGGKKLLVLSAGLIRQWDVAAGAKGRVLGQVPQPGSDLPLRGGGLCCMALSPDGTTIALGDDGNVIRFFDLVRNKALEAPGVHSGGLFVVSFTADDKVLTHSGDAAAYLWDPKKGRAVQRIAVADATVDFLPSPDGRLLAVQDEDSMTVREAAGGKVLCKIGDLKPFERVILFSPDSRLLLAHNLSDPRAVLYDAVTGKQRSSVTVPAFTPTQIEIVDNERLPPLWVFSGGIFSRRQSAGPSPRGPTAALVGRVHGQMPCRLCGPSGTHLSLGVRARRLHAGQRQLGYHGPGVGHQGCPAQSRPAPQGTRRRIPQCSLDSASEQRRGQGLGRRLSVGRLARPGGAAGEKAPPTGPAA
jgi:RNA polymerase sigma factor (sigma-70 family)